MEVLYAVTQSSRKDGVIGALKKKVMVFSQLQNLGQFGLKHWNFKELFSNWSYATVPQNMNKSFGAGQGDSQE
eukprot:2488907-Ditylum_brightwellii.AAC.1